MCPDGGDDVREHGVASRVSPGIVRCFQANNIDVGDDEWAGGACGADQLVIELTQSDPSRAGARQGVDRGSGEFDGERLAVVPGLLALPGGCFAVPGSCLAVLGGQQAMAGCLRSVL